MICNNNGGSDYGNQNARSHCGARRGFEEFTGIAHTGGRGHGACRRHGRRRGGARPGLAAEAGCAAHGADAAQAGRAEPAAPRGGGEPRHALRRRLRLLEREGHRGVLRARRVLLHPQALRRGLGARERPAAHLRAPPAGRAHGRGPAARGAQPRGHGHGHHPR